jgi:hypothetical protein
MSKIIPTDVYDKDGNMLRIEYHDEAGEHVCDVVWDPEDEQTSENREFLRGWASKMMVQKGYEVAT